MRRNTTLTVAPPATGKHIAYDRADKAWVAFYDAQRVGEFDTPEEARAGLDAHVYDLLRRTSWETKDNAAAYAEALAR
jgi:hypothetical protein